MSRRQRDQAQDLPVHVLHMSHMNIFITEKGIIEYGLSCYLAAREREASLRGFRRTEGH
jgi:hypothetical protein